jgi:hypothetical protein
VEKLFNLQQKLQQKHSGRKLATFFQWLRVGAYPLLLTPKGSKWSGKYLKRDQVFFFK